MKQIILLAAILLTATTAMAQRDSTCICSRTHIVLKTDSTDMYTTDTSYMTVSIVHDDLDSYCELLVKVHDKYCVLRQAFNVTIANGDYDGWDGNNEYPYQFAADKRHFILTSND